MTGVNTSNLIELTADIVSAYVQKNAVPVAGLPDLIASVNLALSNVSQSLPAVEPAPVPAVNPKRSIFPDYIISLEDGKRYKSLKRHLSAAHGMTPDEYRAKWGLAKDYPMVAPSYSAVRSAMAKSSGLGRKAAPLPAKKARPKARKVKA
ncbi:MucR family transcriptional regulator [Mesorhizobium ciceri]|uniref:MucR family transcriptional regulator n=1 Tax=Mesorhizobium TaxID=68287 RepID=UPI0007A95574|nr:MucR family transcriptional regulator [Mesorhizobium ciceri]AMY03371.1 transcriptional regulator [Mesorhizobium ciceri biovar biserrulae]